MNGPTFMLSPLFTLIRFILPCKSLLQFKLRGLYVLVAAILLDIGFTLYVSWQGIFLQVLGPGLAITLAVLITFGFLVLVDAVLKARQDRLKERLSALLADPEVPSHIKDKIAHEIFRQ